MSDKTTIGVEDAQVHSSPQQHSILSRLLGTGINRSQTIFVWICLAPILAYFAVFAIYPILATFYMSLHRWSLINPERPYIGLENYYWMLDDPVFVIALKNTILFAVVYLTMCVIIGLVLALLLFNMREPFRSIMQTTLFLPVIVSMIVVAHVWELMYAPGYGILNYFLNFVGLGPFLWTRSTSQVMPSIIMMSVWKGLGYFVVLFVAGLTTIPRSLYEAAWIDGASRWQTLRWITLPLLTPITLFILVIGSIDAFQVFTQVYILTDPPGGPGKSSYTLLIYLFDHGFQNFEMGRASAIAIIMFLLIFMITLFQRRVMRQQFEY